MKMNASQRLRQVIRAAYGAGLRLYPRDFRERYAGEMLSCANQMLSGSTTPLRTAGALTTDFLKSLATEYLAMTPRAGALPQLAMWITLTTFIAGTGYLISQQVLRMSANDPQIELAEDAAQRITAGEDATRVVPERQVDMASSLAPFVIVYDDSGRPVASSGQLDGSVPAPPRGVFDFVRARRQETVTWQPRPGVRIASVVNRSSQGFVVAGRNMREVELREALVFKLAATGWFFANIVLAALWLLSEFLGRRKTPQLAGGAGQPASS
jgi:hypothetical protein